MTFTLIGIDLAAALVLSLALYYRRHRRRDLVVAFLGVNVGVLAVATSLGSAEVALGLGLGLFGVLSIIRLRSSEISQREVAYYFSALAIGLVAGLPAADPLIAGGLIALILVVMWGADHPRLLSRSRHQTVLVDRAIADEDELRAELGVGSAGPRSPRCTIQHLDMVNDTTLVDVRYRAARRRPPRHRGAQAPGSWGACADAPAALDRFAADRPRRARRRVRADHPGRPQVRRPARCRGTTLVARLDDGMRVLERRTALRDFAYESVYFDTPDLLSFRMAAQPRRRRFKLRTRTYLDTRGVLPRAEDPGGAQRDREGPHPVRARRARSAHRRRARLRRRRPGRDRRRSPDGPPPRRHHDDPLPPRDPRDRRRLGPRDGRHRPAVGRRVRRRAVAAAARDHRDEVGAARLRRRPRAVARRSPPGDHQQVRHRPRRPASRSAPQPLGAPAARTVRGRRADPIRSASTSAPPHPATSPHPTPRSPHASPSDPVRHPARARRRRARRLRDHRHPPAASTATTFADRPRPRSPRLSTPN